MSKPRSSGGGGYLIVFTDAKGSTELDEAALLKQASRKGQHRPDTAILKLREVLFKEQLKALKQEKWKIVKSVGDALVLTAEVPRSDGAAMVTECIKDLKRAWQYFNKHSIKIRIAVHYAESDQVVFGKPLAEKLRAGLLDSTLDSLDAFLASLDQDLFGPGINRSARLAHAPSGSLFVLSQGVVLRLLDKKEEFFFANLDKLYNAQLNISSGIELRGPIPLVKVKGVGSVGFAHLNRRTASNPWWIWEVVDETETGGQSFAAENKRFQVIRLVQAMLPEKRTLGDRNTIGSKAQLPDQAFEKHLNKTVALSFFSDLILKVEDVWTYYRPSDDRDFETLKGEKLQWRFQRDQPSKWLTYYAVFNSTPNEATDAIVREALINTREKKGKPTFEAISYPVYLGTRWNSNVRTVVEATSTDAKLYLLFFQVRSSAAGKGGKPDTLFKGMSKTFGDIPWQWRVLSYGVVQGDKDGYMLLALNRGKSEEADKALQLYLKQQCTDDRKGPQTFWERIAPIKVLVCKTRKPIAIRNLEWLNECAVR